MAKHSRYHNKRQAPKRSRPPLAGAALRRSPVPEVRDMTPQAAEGLRQAVQCCWKTRTKNTFKFSGGAWVPHDQKIARYRLDCDVKETAAKSE